MNLCRVRRKAAQQTGHPVVKTRPEIEHGIAAMHHEVRLISAVHAKHPEEMRVIGRQCAKPHQRQRRGPAREMNKLGQQLRSAGAGIDHPATTIDNRSFSPHHDVHSRADRGRVGFGLRHVAGLRRRLVQLHAIGDIRHQNVFRQIDQDRSGTARRGDMERLDHGCLEFFHILHEIIMLRAGACDTGRVGLLECVIADQMCWHLPGQTDNGHRIHQRIGKAGDSICRAGAGGHKHNTGLAGRAGIALGGMNRRLLMPDQNVSDLVVLEQRVIDREHGTTRIAEDNLDSLILERLQKQLGTRHPRRHCRAVCITLNICCRR